MVLKVISVLQIAFDINISVGQSILSVALD